MTPGKRYSRPSALVTTMESPKPVISSPRRHGPVGRRGEVDRLGVVGGGVDRGLRGLDLLLGAGAFGGQRHGRGAEQHQHDGDRDTRPGETSPCRDPAAQGLAPPDRHPAEPVLPHGLLAPAVGQGRHDERDAEREAANRPVRR
nr:hypothetical protein DA06_04030 [Georgenia sp. SUBG003]